MYTRERRGLADFMCLVPNGLNEADFMAGLSDVGSDGVDDVVVNM